MTCKKTILLVASGMALAGFASRVVPVDRPGLVLPGKTLADVRTNAVSGCTVGAFFFPGELTGMRKTVVAGTAARPEKLHVEMQNLDSGFLKALVLELTERADGVWGQVIAARGSTAVRHSRRPSPAGRARSWPRKPCGLADVSSGDAKRTGRTRG